MRVGESRLHPDRAGALIDLVVDQGDGAAIQLNLAVAGHRGDADSSRLQRTVESRQRFFRQSENAGNRLYLGHDNDAAGIRRVHVVARIHAPYAGLSLDRRDDGGVAELRPGVVDVGLVALDLGLQLPHQGVLRVQRLFAGQILRSEQLKTIQVGLGARELGHILVVRRNRLIEGRPEGPRVDLADEVPFLEGLALDKPDFLQLAVDAGRHGHRIEGLHRAQTLEIDRYFAAAGQCGLHRDLRMPVALLILTGRARAA